LCQNYQKRLPEKSTEKNFAKQRRDRTTNATLNTERYPCQPKLPIIRIMIDLAQNFSHTRRLFNVFENNFHGLA
jgi:hypothetical protein